MTQSDREEMTEFSQKYNSMKRKGNIICLLTINLPEDIQQSKQTHATGSYVKQTFINPIKSFYIENMKQKKYIISKNIFLC